MTGNAERRRAPRQRLAAFAAITAIGRHPNDQAFSAVVDISRTGICLRTGQPPRVGQSAYLRLAIDEDIHTLQSRVTRVQPRSGTVFEVGLDWSSCSTEELEFLDRYVAAAGF